MVDPLINRLSLPLLSLEVGCGGKGTEAASSLLLGVAVGASAGTGLIGDKAGPERFVVVGGTVDLEFMAA